eukprot:COSAG01_NODE_19_length_39011_cov_38.134968_25_plen_74_part_00
MRATPKRLEAEHFCQVAYCAALFVGVCTDHNYIVTVHSTVALRAGNFVPGGIQNKIAVVVGVVMMIIVVLLVY